MTKLDDYIESVRKKYNLPTLAAGVMQQDKETISVCGIRKKDDPEGTKAEPGDKFHFGSCGKTVTAALIHKLIGEEKLFTLKSTVADLLPSMQIAEANRSITVEQLLTHTSGLLGNREVPNKLEAVTALKEEEKTTSPLNMRRALTETTLSTAARPNQNTYPHDYGNINYIILAAIAETQTGKTFEELIKTKIFDFLRMQSAGFGLPAQNDSPPDQPWGHRREGDRVIPDTFDNPAFFAPVSTMHASLSDWLKFLNFEMNQFRLLNPALTVSDNNGNKHTDSALIRIGDGFVYDGSNTRNYTRQILLPKTNAALVIATNDGSTEAVKAIEEVTEYMLDHEIEKSQATPRPSSQNVPGARGATR